MSFKSLTAEERRVKRERIREEVIERAIASSQLGRSMKCSGIGFSGIPHHAGEPDLGCKNDGTGCICECHDPVTTSPELASASPQA